MTKRLFSLSDFIDPNVPPPTAPEMVSEELRKQLHVYKQAMPLSRLLGNGMENTDAVAMHALSEQGIQWADAGEWLGERNVLRAQLSLQAGHALTARSFYRYASACYRFGQISLSGDTERKRNMYRKLIQTFGAAGVFDNPSIQKVVIPYLNSELSGWLMLPFGIEAPPVVIVMGGFDGWREEYHSGAQYLVERGIAVLLVDGPGQGETRLFHYLYLTSDVEKAFSCIVDYLLADLRVGERIGMWGNSFGGLLAALTISADHRIQACCINGSPVRPIETFERFPPLIGMAGALVGTNDRDTVLAVIRQLSLIPENNRIQCALLQLHGALDSVSPLVDARTIYEDAPSTDKQIIIWQDGDHCVYNHSHEKHSIMADWFHERLCDR